jgi:hypothetical protein
VLGQGISSYRFLGIEMFGMHTFSPIFPIEHLLPSTGASVDLSIVCIFRDPLLGLFLFGQSHAFASVGPEQMTWPWTTTTTRNKHVVFYGVNHVDILLFVLIIASLHYFKPLS